MTQAATIPLPPAEAAANKRLLAHVFAETEAGNGGPFWEMLADDIRWTIIGRNAWSTTHDGKEALRRDLFGPLRRKFDGINRVKAIRLIAEDDCVAVEGRGNAVLKDGTPYRNEYCWVFRFRAGKVVEAIEYMDTELVTAVLGNPD